MEKVIINSYEEFEKLVGQQIGVSDYVELSQERINLFADATLDRSEEHTSELQSPYVISYAVFCLKKHLTHRPGLVILVDTRSSTPVNSV